LTSKLIAGVAVSILQVYAFLIIAYFWEIEPPTWWGYLTWLPAMALSGLMLARSHAVVVAHQATREFCGGDELVIFRCFRVLRLYPLLARAGGKPVVSDCVPAQPVHFSSN